MQIKNEKKVIFFPGSYFFRKKIIPLLENMQKQCKVYGINNVKYLDWSVKNEKNDPDSIAGFLPAGVCVC